MPWGGGGTGINTLRRGLKLGLEFSLDRSAIVLIVPTIKNGEELCIRVCFILFGFGFPRKTNCNKQSSDWAE